MEKFSEIVNSCFESVKNRLSNPIYGIFIVTWAITNWNFVYSILFLDSQQILDKTELLKNEYLVMTFFNVDTVLYNILMHLVIPLFTTYLIIWVFPKHVFLPAFKKEEEYKTEKQKIKILQTINIEKSKVDLENINLNKTKIIKDKIKEEKEIIGLAAPKWEKEFEQFRKSKFFNFFKIIINVIYEHSGNLNYASMPVEVLVYYDTNDLVVINGRTISFTQKGKFFVKLYSNLQSAT